MNTNYIKTNDAYIFRDEVYDEDRDKYRLLCLNVLQDDLKEECFLLQQEQQATSIFPKLKFRIRLFFRTMSYLKKEREEEADWKKQWS